jgi:hypothetical protein
MGTLLVGYVWNGSICPTLIASVKESQFCLATLVVSHSKLSRICVSVESSSINEFTLANAEVWVMGI